ncbi:MAG: hypothetical protein J6J16_02155 [Lachnospiraceae bacterium]|nr:hypothetical protein [Lachnospiraceae bacterium]
MMTEEQKIAREYFLQGENEKCFYQLAELDSLDFEDVLMLAEVQIRLDLLSEAESNLNLLLEENYNLATVYFDLGNVCIKRDDMSKAKEYYNLAISNGCKSANLYCNLGLMSMAEFDFKNAIEMYNMAEELDSDDITPVDKLLALYISTGDYEKSLEKCDKLITMIPKNYVGYHKKFIILVSSNRVFEAEEYLFSIKSLFENSREYLYDIAYLYQKKKEYQVGYDFIMSNLEILGEDEMETKKYLAEFLMLMGKHEEAKMIFEKMLDVEEDIAALHAMMLYAFVEKNPELTIEYAERITELSVRDIRYYNALYYMCLASKVCESEEVFRERTETALYFMQDKTIYLPENIQAFLHRAILYHSIGMKEEALRDMDFVIDVLGEASELTNVRDKIAGAK